MRPQIAYRNIAGDYIVATNIYIKYIYTPSVYVNDPTLDAQVPESVEIFLAGK